jgi:hypothetical protein
MGCLCVTIFVLFSFGAHPYSPPPGGPHGFICDPYVVIGDSIDHYQTHPLYFVHSNDSVHLVLDSYNIRWIH